MIRKHLVAAFLALALLVSCETYEPSKQDIGMATGAIVGGVLGHQIGGGSGRTVATIGGAALGGFVATARSQYGSQRPTKTRKRGEVPRRLFTSGAIQITDSRFGDAHQYIPGRMGHCRDFTRPRKSG